MKIRSTPPGRSKKRINEMKRRRHTQRGKTRGAEVDRKERKIKATAHKHVPDAKTSQQCPEHVAVVVPVVANRIVASEVRVRMSGTKYKRLLLRSFTHARHYYVGFITISDLTASAKVTLKRSLLDPRAV